MSQLSVNLITFKKKIEEAVILVPEMCAEEKLKAVQFWNVVSERLQEIVNNSAADINALAMRLEQDEAQGQHTQPLHQHSLPQDQHQHTEHKHSSPQSTGPVMDTVPTVAIQSDGSLSNDKPELYLPIITHSNSCSHQNIINDNSIISNSSSHMTNTTTNGNELIVGPNSHNSHIVANDEMDEHLQSVITSYHESNEESLQNTNHIIEETSQQLLIAFHNQKPIQESQQLLHFSQTQHELDSRNSSIDVLNTSCSSSTATVAATTSVIQEVVANDMITSQRRNVIQSTQRAIEAIEKNLQNCCNDFVLQNRNKNQFKSTDNQFINTSDNTCDETLINCNNNNVINSNNSINSNNNSNHTMIKVIESATDESQGESSATNHIFINETSFDVSSASYGSSISVEDIDQQKKPKFKIDENHTNNSNTINTNIIANNNNIIKQKSINNSIKTKNGIKKKSRIQKTRDNSIKNAETIDNKSQFECDICHKVLANNSALVTHQWIHSKPYSCSECEARFSTKGNLLVHQRRHTGEKPFACDRCPASFSTKGNLKRHIKAHSGERPWKCSQCDSRFTEKKSLKVHMRRHTGEKPYQCSVCGKSFSQTGVLQTHMALHLDERKHLCELCGKAFRQRSQLRLHVLRHEGVKRWDCSDCEAKFLTKGDLERHHRVHTGERPFVCDLCGKTFTRQQSLNEHSNRHYGLKPYACTVCSKTFAEMSACYKHIKVHKKQQMINNNKSNESMDKTSAKQQTITTNKQLNTNQSKTSDELRNTRSVINVIQSTTSSTKGEKGLVYVNRSKQMDNNINVSIDDSVISSNSNTNTNDNNSIEYCDFTAINLLANTSTQQQIIN